MWGRTCRHVHLSPLYMGVCVCGERGGGTGPRGRRRAAIPILRKGREESECVCVCVERGRHRVSRSATCSRMANALRSHAPRTAPSESSESSSICICPASQPRRPGWSRVCVCFTLCWGVCGLWSLSLLLLSSPCLPPSLPRVFNLAGVCVCGSSPESNSLLPLFPAPPSSPSRSLSLPPSPSLPLPLPLSRSLPPPSCATL